MIEYEMTEQKEALWARQAKNEEAQARIAARNDN